MRLVKLISIFLIGFALFVVLPRGIRMSVPYSSVHALGYRFGQAVPFGEDITRKRNSRQVVRIEPISFYRAQKIPDRPPAGIYDKIKSGQIKTNPQVIYLDYEEVLLPLIVLLSALITLVASWHGRRDYDEFNDGPTAKQLVAGKRLVQAGVSIVSIGVLGCVLFMLYRVFLTGVDDAMMSRTSYVIPGSTTVHYSGNSTLSMTAPTLLMLYCGFVMILIPIMFAAGMRCMGVPGYIVGKQRERVPFSHRSLFAIFASSYALITLMMITAPWSTTLYNVFLGL